MGGISIYLYIYLSIYLSTYLSIYLSIYLDAVDGTVDAADAAEDTVDAADAVEVDAVEQDVVDAVENDAVEPVVDAVEVAVKGKRPWAIEVSLAHSPAAQITAPGSLKTWLLRNAQETMCLKTSICADVDTRGWERETQVEIAPVKPRQLVFLARGDVLSSTKGLHQYTA